MDIDSPFENSRKFAVPADIDSPPGHVEQSLSIIRKVFETIEDFTFDKRHTSNRMSGRYVDKSYEGRAKTKSSFHGRVKINGSRVKEKSTSYEGTV